MNRFSADFGAAEQGSAVHRRCIMLDNTKILYSYCKIKTYYLITTKGESVT